MNIEKFSKNSHIQLEKILSEVDFFKNKNLRSSRQSLWHAISLKNIKVVLDNNRLDLILLIDIGLMENEEKKMILYMKIVFGCMAGP